jgi:tRNA (guanine-N7-)-methyltransferase
MTTTSIRTYHPRRGRLSARHHDALERLWPRFGVDDGLPAQGLTAQGLTARRRPLVLEIGSGMGDAVVAMAGADPDRDYLAVDVHTPGVANLLAMVEERGLTNVWVGRTDALELLRHHVQPKSLDAVHAFFPDPWPKARHHKRRLVQPAHVALIASRLRPGGLLHCATDDEGYALSMMDTLNASAVLANTCAGFAVAHGRPPTKFEKRAREAGRDVFDLVFTALPGES